eukprot:Hpha_TRINITY_DN15709_c5_g7::TRINITY_DN15709_c5_g7_i1::g.37319::m.37319
MLHCPFSAPLKKLYFFLKVRNVCLCTPCPHFRCVPPPTLSCRLIEKKKEGVASGTGKHTPPASYTVFFSFGFFRTPPPAHISENGYASSTWDCPSDTPP